MRTFFICMSILFLMSSCLSTIMDDDYGRVDPKLQPYLDAFIEEAGKRGIQINTATLKLDFGDLKGADGRTYYEYSQIVIDSMSSDWQSGTGESLVFHELGHLFLRRKHDEAMLDKWNCKSIMAGKKDPYYLNKKFYRREYYLNELFNPSEVVPDWIEHPEKYEEKKAEPVRPDSALFIFNPIKKR